MILSQLTPISLNFNCNLNTNLNLAKIHLHSTDLYKALEKETGQPTGFHETGSLRLAYKKEDLEWFKHTKGMLDIVGAPSEIISTSISIASVR